MDQQDDRRRIGRFVIDHQLIERKPHLVRAVMGKVIVLMAQYRPDLGGIEYMAESPMFEPIEPGMAAPTYHWGIDDDTRYFIRPYKEGDGYHQDLGRWGR